MKKVLLPILALFLFAQPVHAQYVVSSPQAVSNIVLNKLVQNPNDKQFYKDLCALKVDFLPGNQVTFRLDVTNNGQTQLTNIAVKDILPANLDFVSGPGNFDSASHTLNFTIDSLNIGETKSPTFIAKVNNNVTDAPVCITNTAEVRVNSLFQQSTALLPVEKPLAPVQQLPQTGPKETAELLLGSTILLGLSIKLFRVA